MICYAVIDTNVLVSALLSSKDDAATVQVLGKMLNGEIIPVYSNVITKEYREVLGKMLICPEISLGFPQA